MDVSTLKPINFVEIDPLYAKEWVKKILLIIEKQKELQLPWKNLALAMHCPSVKRCEMILALVNSKLAKANLRERIEIANFYKNMLTAVCLDDPFAIKKNIVHNKNKIKKILKKLKPASPSFAKKLGRLSNACYNLSYGIYSDINPQICYENFGPYKIGDERLVIKKFQNLKPHELWGSIVNDIPCNLIKIYCLYKNVEFSVDIASHAKFKGDTINGLKYCALEVDGKSYDINKIDSLIEKIELKSIKMWKNLTSLGFGEAKIKYLEQRCYNYINICKLLGLDWRPTKEMLEAVKNKKLVKDFLPKFNNPEEETRFWRIMIDPRVNPKEVSQYFNR